jgi:hypothetical protein
LRIGTQCAFFRAVHSITSSAVARSEAGMVRSSIRAVEALMTSSYLHDQQVRRLRALKDAADQDAGLTICISLARSVAHQPTGVDKVAP